MREKKTLTRAEFAVMEILWNLPTKGAFTSDILACYADPKPAYTTLATFLKILTTKGYVKSIKVGSMLYYTPLVSQAEYAEVYLGRAKDIFFGGSFASLMSFFVKRENLSQEQVDELVGLIKDSQENQ